jgi:hypothetical protein
VLDELGEWLKRDGKADHITLSGSGEPTLHSSFGEVLGFVRKNSEIRAVLLTNGSLFHLREVRMEASQAEIIAEYRDKGGFEILANEELIISMLKRRPCTTEDIAGAFGMHFNEVSKHLGNLMRQGRIRTERADGSFYYKAIIQEQKESYSGVNNVAKNSASDLEVPGHFVKRNRRAIRMKKGLSATD